MRPPESEDREIARQFRELRERELASVPGFRQFLARAARTSAGPRLRVASGVLALLAVAVVAALLLSRRAPEGLDPSASSALSHWKASTDVLLDTPGSRLLKSSPTVPEPVPDYSAFADPTRPQETKPTRSPKGA